MELNDRDIGIITAGISYQYAKEVFPKYSYLKLGMVWPLPKNLIAEFFKKVKKVFVIEELDPFLEENIRVMGFKAKGGKNLFSVIGEYTPLIVERGMLGNKFKPPEPVFTDALPHTNLCPRSLREFFTLKNSKSLPQATSDTTLAVIRLCLAGHASAWGRHGSPWYGWAMGMPEREGLSFPPHGGSRPDERCLARLYDHHPSRQSDDRNDRFAGAPGNWLHAGKTPKSTLSSWRGWG
jgi:hypothetical protein